VLTSTPVSTVVDYLQLRALKAMAGHLSQPFRDEIFDLAKKLYGLKEPTPLWKKCVAVVDGAFGFALGKAFVDQNFAGSSESTATDMIEGIKGVFRRNLPNLDWMDGPTRDLAQDKADKVMQMIGYPTNLITEEQLATYYSKLAVDSASYFTNILSSHAFALELGNNKLGKPVDRSEWHMSPPTVNAYYSPTENQIVFPAGIMQPPFFHKDFLMAANFGGIGSVMGHELTHGFDDSGSQFDKDGNMRPWWPEEIRASFDSRTQCIAKQYSAYSVNGLNVNGNLTLGENIADNGGLKQAYGAYAQWLQEHNAGKEEPVLPGLRSLTARQLFFVGFATPWCGAQRPEAARMQILTDPHSPGRWRVIGTLSNSPEFAAAYKCAAGTPMNPIEKCTVW